MANEPHGRAPALILEDLAAAVMGTDAADEAGVARLLAMLEELAATGEGSCAAPASAAAARIRVDAADVRALAGALDATSEDVARMQEAFANAAQAQPEVAAPQPAASSDPGALVLPDWSDEKVLKDFLAAQRGSLEELEQEILAMEGGNPERRGAFRRRLHTMKGEAGVLGLDDMERVCHATEDFTEASGVSADVTDRLLKVRDWMAKAVDAYARMRLPQPRAEDFVKEALARASASAAAQPAPGPSAAAGQPARPSDSPSATPVGQPAQQPPRGAARDDGGD